MGDSESVVSRMDDKIEALRAANITLDTENAQLRKALRVIRKGLSEDADGEFWPARRWLDTRGIYHGDLSGPRVLELVAKHVLHGNLQDPDAAEIATLQDRERHVTSEYLKIIEDLRAEVLTLRADQERMREALQDAKRFIVNGVELGYILMPDPDLPDSAHQTLPKILAALSTPRQP